MINLDPGLEVTTSDGDMLGVGEVVLLEDTTGKGHITKLVGERLHRGIFVPID